MTVPEGEAPPLASSGYSPEEAVRDFLRYLPRPGRVLVAFSGGGDSTGLLAVLKSLNAPGSGIDIHAATVDHGLRHGSAEEALAASGFCARLGVPHAILAWSGEKPVTGIQARAREARYRLLAAEAARIGADLIVTGHTRDDQMETLTMRRSRDPGAEEGMDEAVLVERRIWVFRPFLPVGRDAIRDWLRARGFGWSEDPSNDNPAFERVRVRRGATGHPGPWPPPQRDRRHADAARFIRDRVRMHPGLVASVDLSDFEPMDAASRHALLALAAVLGGRRHPAGRPVEWSLSEVLEQGADFRLTASRVVFDRRKATLFLCREARSLPDMTLDPGGSAPWDGRFELVNRGDRPARIAAGRAFETAPPLLPPPWSGGLPGGVFRRGIATMPRVVSGQAAALDIRPLLAPFEHFLPARKLELAQSLADLLGLEHFRASPIDRGTF